MDDTNEKRTQKLLNDPYEAKPKPKVANKSSKAKKGK